MTNQPEDPYPRCWVARKSYNPVLAALFSLILPGAGQAYRGYVLRGIAWCSIILLCYSVDFLRPLGVGLHLWCMLAAALAEAKD